MDTNPSENDTDIAVYIDPAEALNSLSIIQIYNVNKLCVANLKEKGWDMLEDNIDKKKCGHTMFKTEEASNSRGSEV